MVKVANILKAGIIFLLTNEAQGLTINQKLKQVLKQNNKDDEEDLILAFNASASIGETMKQYQGDFDATLFQQLLTLPDISHLLYSEVVLMMQKLSTEFPDIVQMQSIGRTWQDRDIYSLTLDARDVMRKQGIHPYSEDKPVMVQIMSEEELLAQEGSSQQDKVKEGKKSAKDEVDSIYNQLNDDEKGEAINSQLGIELLQTGSIKQSLQKNVNDQNLVQTKGKQKKDPIEIDADDGEISISELTNQAKAAILGQNEAFIKDSKTTEKKQTQQKPKEKQQTVEKQETPEKLETEEKQETEELVEKKPEKKVEETPTVIQKEKAQKPKFTQKDAEQEAEQKKGNAVLLTGATHARELLSMQVPLYVVLKMIHQGYIQKKPKYQQMLATVKFHIVPAVNVDGAVLVEQNWKSDHKILNKRKNMNPELLGICGSENGGVDLNRNWGRDWRPSNVKNQTEVCGDFWPGSEAFSEPESRAMRDFVAAHKMELKFIINCHTSGNQFIWPYNAKDPNDIETRSPGYLALFQDIAKNAHLPDGTMTGNSYEVIGDTMGGDADDYIMSTYGIPSVTSEMGFFGQYIKDWRCTFKSVCLEIVRENERWMEYIFENIGKIADKIVIK